MIYQANTLSTSGKITDLCNDIKNRGKVYTKKTLYYNTAASFDIESSSFLYRGQKAACMYIWSMNIEGTTLYGRTWDEFLSLLRNLSDALLTGIENRYCIYVHNLSYEFQFIRKHFEWETVFCSKERRPYYALTKSGIEFRCSYMLSRMSLNNLAKTLKCGVRKLIGDLDYELIRHSNTVISDAELKYSENDAIIVYEYIQEKIIEDGGMHKIPLTQTGYVRNYCRKACIYDNKSHKKSADNYIKWRRFITTLSLAPDEYLMLKRAFQGGFTHANAYKVGRVISNVGAKDEMSAYPAMMVSRKFPMSRGEFIKIQDVEQFRFNIERYCCIFDIRFTNIIAKTMIENPISSSRCRGLECPVIDNGRVVSANVLITTITEQDYIVYKHFYAWDKAEIGAFVRYKKSYLPKALVASVLKFYADKTTLKDVDGKEVEYAKSKEMINAAYGMMVTDLVRDEILYNENEWSTQKPDLSEAVEKYNNDKKRFLFYPWGVWVTAYARRAVLEAVYNVGTDYCYSDTDSCKYENPDKHEDFFKFYSAKTREMMIKAMQYHGFDLSLFEPKAPNGKVKSLGSWDTEEPYDNFKTLGAKRYFVQQGDKYALTVAGVSKQKACEYLAKQQYPFDTFCDSLSIPPEYSGKLTLTYCDDALSGEIVDYKGVVGTFSELSYIHASPVGHNLSLSQAYADYLKGIITIEE